MRVPHALSSVALIHNARFIRPALIALILVDLIALAAFSVRLESVSTTTSTPAPTYSTAPSLPVTVPPGVPVAPPAAPVVPVGTPISTGGTTITPATPASPSTPTPTVDPTDGTDPTQPSAAIARCTIPIKEPTTSGGLQTLIGYAPAFGPFKAEAFALASVYQPLLQMLGPVLAKYPAIAPRIEPAMKPFLDAFAGLLDQVFSLISPFYSPYRQAFLEAEGKLAAALAPFTETLATSPLGGCVVELQAALLEDSKAEDARASTRSLAKARQARALLVG